LNNFKLYSVFFTKYKKIEGLIPIWRLVRLSVRQIFIKFGVEILYEKLWSKREFLEKSTQRESYLTAWRVLISTPTSHIS